MSILRKFAAGLSSFAMVATMFAPVATNTVHAATAGGVYKTPEGTVWFVTSDMKRRPFTSAGAFLSYGFLSFSQVVDADASVTALPEGPFIAPQDGRIFCATATKGTDVAGECAEITGSMKASFTSAAVFAAQGFSFSRAFYGDSSFLTKTSNIDNGSAQHRAGTLINNGGTVQLVVTGGLWGVPSLDVFNSWGWSFADVVPANSADTALTQTGIIPGRVAGQLVPTATTGGGGGGTTACVNDGSEGSVSTYALGAAEETEALEGQDEVEIYAADVELNNDGDLCLDRIDVWFSQTATASDDPWDYFTEIMLMVNGEEVASMDADSASDWFENEGASELGTANTDNEYRMRFSGLNAGLEDGETADISVAVSMVNNLDSADEDAVWVVEIDDDAGFRFTDGTGFTFTDGPGDGTTLEDSFTTGAEDAAVLSLTLSEDSPEASVIEISETANTDDVHIATYTIEETNDVDVNVSEITVDITIVDPAGGVDPAGAGVVAPRAMLVVDGDVIGTETVGSGADTAAVVFDGLDLDVDGDSEVDVEVWVDIEDTNSAARFDEGTTINADDFDVTEFEDAAGNDEGDTAVTEAGIGEAHELRTEGIMLEFVSSSAVKTFTADSTGEEDQGTFKITFEASAFGDDMRIDRTCALDEDQGDAGEGLSLLITNSGDLAGDTIDSCIITSSTTDSEDNGNVFEVDENSTRTFTLTVVATNDGLASDFHEMSLEAVNYGTATDDTNASFYTFNLDEFKTDPLFLTFVP